ncbi:MAG: hypothetical protein K6L76_05585 [Agarilytica sp.]
MSALFKSFVARRAAVIFFASIVGAFAQAQPEVADYNQMVVFGNSLSDNGNAHQVVCDPSECGPDLFTNGKVVVEYLAELFTYPEPALSVAPAKNYTVYDTMGYSFDIYPPEGTNYAVAGTLVPVERQVGRYLASVSRRANEQGLYVFFLGGNWVNYSLQQEIEGEACSAEDPNVCPGRKAGMDRLAAYAQSLRSSMQELIDAGAKHILVINTDSFATIPNGPALFPEYLAELDAYAFEYNHLVHQHIATLEQNFNINIQLFDLYTRVEEIKASHEDFQMTNIEDACGIYNTSTLSFDYTAPCSEQNVSGYMYYDGIHWAESMHRTVASTIFLEALDMGPAKPELSFTGIVVSGSDRGFMFDASIDVTVASVQFPYASYPAQKNGSGLGWSVNVENMAPGKYPYSIVLENSEGVKSRSYGDAIYVCEEKTLDQFVSSGQVQYTPGFRWFWFSTPGEYVISSTGERVGGDDDGNTRLSLLPVNGAWEYCPE